MTGIVLAYLAIGCASAPMAASAPEAPLEASMASPPPPPMPAPEAATAVVSNVTVGSDVAKTEGGEKQLDEKPAAHGKKTPDKTDSDKKRKSLGRTADPTDALTAGKNADPSKEGSVTPGSATTTSLGNAISAADVDAAVAQKLHPLRACATSDSTVSVHLSVAPGGKVADASATRSTPDDARLRDCVELALRTLYFGSSPTDRATALSFDLDLKPLASP